MNEIQKKRMREGKEDVQNLILIPKIESHLFNLNGLVAKHPINKNKLRRE